MVHQQTWNRRQTLSGLRAGATLAVAGAAMPAFSNVAMAQDDATPVAGRNGHCDGERERPRAGQRRAGYGVGHDRRGHHQADAERGAVRSSYPGELR